MRKRRIRKVAVLGAGLMGSSIACHFAGCGFNVLLLDLPSEGKDKNKNVKEALDRCLKSKPANIFHKKFVSNIECGNFDDDLVKLKDCDWVIEVIIERLDLKKSLYEKIENHRKPKTLITSNTSGIPVQQLVEERTEDFKEHFCVTHFFNPPRYLPLLEVIPSQETHPEVLEFIQDFGKRFLGKQVVICKDTPAFIANRIGVPAMGKVFELAYELKLNIGDVDKLTGPALGRPKSGTFRLTDVVGLDTALMVIQALKVNCPQDRLLQEISSPPFLEHLSSNKWFGNKSGKGFFVKSTELDSSGKAIIHAMDLQTLEYRPDPKTLLESIQISKQIEELPKRLKAILKCNDDGAVLIRKSLGFLFGYTANRIPEISDHLFSVDQALRNGFGWEMGPFEYWDAIGFEEGLALLKELQIEAPNWLEEMQAKGLNTFYQIKDSKLKCINPLTLKYDLLPDQDDIIQLKYLTQEKTILKNSEIKLHDIEDGVLCLEFTSKYNAIGEGILKGIQDSIQLAEDQGWKGIVIGNNATNFTVGANLMLIGMLAFQQEYEMLNQAVKLFQQTSMRCRYSAIPLVAATQGYVFGGGTEILMHCDAAVCAVESYIGLVEVGVGLLPGGGGTKEFALRFSDQMKPGEVQIPQLIDAFKTIATASVATSAHEAFDYGYLLKSRDQVNMHNKTQIHRAKRKVIELAEQYTQPVSRNDINVLGRSGLGTLNTAAFTLLKGGYASEHDIKIAKKIAHVLCGGDLSGPQIVSEEYLLDLEREAFLSLCTEPKTMARIQHMLENNKPLRN